ncbi:hypothetical protein MTR_2g044980 [Medicago truncatula]|uniref:Secreted protein n=1 Tax=Medicago truncatula TaxID=3880 RepID=G7IQC8_MEDTR|nr:hypothetical protein MTR_2g044980 [Medicago truncatula]
MPLSLSLSLSLSPSLLASPSSSSFFCKHVESIIRTVTDTANLNCGKKSRDCKNYRNSFEKEIRNQEIN